MKINITVVMNIVYTIYLEQNGITYPQEAIRHKHYKRNNEKRSIYHRIYTSVNHEIYIINIKNRIPENDIFTYHPTDANISIPIN